MKKSMLNIAIIGAAILAFYISKKEVDRLRVYYLNQKKKSQLAELEKLYKSESISFEEHKKRMNEIMSQYV